MQCKESVHTFFTIFVKHTGVNGEFWAPYGGSNWWLYDWWNVSPTKFVSEDSAMNAIQLDRNFKECNWRIVKTTVTNETVKVKEDYE